MHSMQVTIRQQRIIWNNLFLWTLPIMKYWMFWHIVTGVRKNMSRPWKSSKLLWRNLLVQKQCLHKSTSIMVEDHWIRYGRLPKKPQQSNYDTDRKLVCNKNPVKKRNLQTEDIQKNLYILGLFLFCKKVFWNFLRNQILRGMHRGSDSEVLLCTIFILRKGI